METSAKAKRYSENLTWKENTVFGLFADKVESRELVKSRKLLVIVKVYLEDNLGLSDSESVLNDINKNVVEC